MIYIVTPFFCYTKKTHVGTDDVFVDKIQLVVSSICICQQAAGPSMKEAPGGFRSQGDTHDGSMGTSPIYLPDP